MKLIGRKTESELVGKALSLHRNVLIEGPVGVGKTFLVKQILEASGRDFERVDGDTRYTEQKLTGWFDPPLVVKKGYTKETFIEGPLLRAMQKGRVLFVNELNRMPEAVQNILLPAMDERHIQLPKLGQVKAKKGFCLVATQNPREFTATHVLSEALLDRFEMIPLDYQDEEEEMQILKELAGKAFDETLFTKCLSVVRNSRNHPKIKRGASIRAAHSIAELSSSGVDFEQALQMALPGRIELISAEENFSEILKDLLSESQKKKD